MSLIVNFAYSKWLPVKNFTVWFYNQRNFYDSKSEGSHCWEHKFYLGDLFRTLKTKFKFWIPSSINLPIVKYILRLIIVLHTKIIMIKSNLYESICSIQEDCDKIAGLVAMIKGDTYQKVFTEFVESECEENANFQFCGGTWRWCQSCSCSPELKEMETRTYT